MCYVPPFCFWTRYHTLTIPVLHGMLKYHTLTIPVLHGMLNYHTLTPMNSVCLLLKAFEVQRLHVNALFRRSLKVNLP